VNKESRNAGKALSDSEITDRIIAAAIDVHRELGPGFLESIYENALAVEFALRGIAFIRQKPIPLFYKDHQIGEHRLDFLVEGKIVVELKGNRNLGRCPFRNCPKLFESNEPCRRFDFKLRDGATHNKARLP